ncbi:MAG: hypothetical protein QXR41_06435 [Nitrososphaerota archaeon]
MLLVSPRLRAWSWTLLGGALLREKRRPPTNMGGIMFRDLVLPVGSSPRPGKRTSLLWLEGSLLLGTPRYTPAWEKTSSIVPRALEESEEELEGMRYID